MSVQILTPAELGHLAAYLVSVGCLGADLLLEDLSRANARAYGARYDTGIDGWVSASEIRRARHLVSASVSGLQALRILRKLGYNVLESEIEAHEAVTLFNAYREVAAAIPSSAPCGAFLCTLARLSRLGERAWVPRVTGRLIRRLYSTSTRITQGQPATTYASTF